MENKKAIIVVAVSVAVGLVVLAGLRFWPENSSRLADKALTSAVDQAGKDLAAAESLLGNPTAEFVQKDGTVAAGPWVKGLPAPLPEDSMLYLAGSQLTDAQRTAQETKWKEFVDAGKVPYRLMTAPTVNAQAMTDLESARKTLQGALETHGEKGTPKVVALANAKLGAAWLLTGRAYSRQVAMSGAQLGRQLAQASSCLDHIASQLSQADYYRQFKDKIAKGVDPKLNEESKSRQADLKTKREAAESAAATLRQDAKTAQDEGDRLRKEANEDKAAGAAGEGKAAAETTLKAIAKDKAASEAHAKAEGLEKNLADKENEIAQLKIEEDQVAKDLAMDVTTQADRDKAMADADKRVAEIEAAVKARQDELAGVLADAAGWLTDKERRVSASAASEKRPEAAAGEEAPASEPASAPASAPAARAVKPAPVEAGASLPVMGVMAAQTQARQAFVEAQKALDAAEIPATGEDPDGAEAQTRAQAKLDQGIARLAKASLSLEGVLLAEQVRALRDRATQLLPDSEAAKSLQEMAMKSLAPEAALARVPASSPASAPASDPALAGANEWRDQAAKLCEEAAKLQFGEVVKATTESKIHWAGYTLAGLAWEKAYQLRAGRHLEGALETQNASDKSNDLAEAKKAVNSALTGPRGAEDRKESPFLAPALLLRARLDAIK